MNNYLKAYFFPALLFVLITSCHGQNTSLVESGESVSEMDDSLIIVFQDKNNNYWFGSNGKGVYRYYNEKNGARKKIIHYSTKDGLCDNRIWKIEEDKSGNIYFTTQNGISKYDGQKFTTLSITTNSNDNWKAEPDDLWFKSSQDSGVVYRYDGKSLHRLEFPKTKAGNDYELKWPRSKFKFRNHSPYDVYTIYKDRRGNVWFGTSSLGVCLYDGKSFNWISESELGLDEIAFGVRSILEDKEGKFWFSNSRYRFNVYENDSLRENSSINFKREKGIGNAKDNNENEFTYAMSMVEDNNGELWLVTYGRGVWRYDPKNPEAEINHYPIKDGETNINLFTVYKDNRGDLWLGTHNGGAYKFNGKTFEKFLIR